MKKVKLIIGIILLIIGAFYAVIPHSVHISSGMGLELSHSLHILLGIILLVAGIIGLLIGKK